MEEKEKIPYAQGKLINDALKKLCYYYACISNTKFILLFLSSGVIIVFTGILVTIGRTGGAGILFGWNIPSFIVGLIKSRSLFTSKYWDLMDQKIPS